ncbi:MAG TPA: pyridoxamine 5'-phosphate oxidase family protein [Phenylobacterium sp.]|nr:pyridoxamine 5'-phosphate oxidase family protein [Phenylobacterium sp.]
MNQVIDPDLAAFMESPVMVVLATRSAAMRPAIARAVGVRLSPDRAVADLFVSRAQWPQAVDGLQPGAAMAVTVCNPPDYRTYQIKGRLAEVAPADADDHAVAGGYMSAVGQVLAELGVSRRQIASWLTTEDLLRLRLIPMSAFVQTPGPGAGAARTSGAEGAA